MTLNSHSENDDTRPVDPAVSHLQSTAKSSTGQGMCAVNVGERVVHITEVDDATLCMEWTKLKRELADVYSINRRANSGWRGIVIRLLGIHLPDKNKVLLGGINALGESTYTSTKE